MEKELLSVRQMSEFLGVSVRTGYRYLEKREFPYIKEPLRIRRDDLEHWLNEGKVEALLSRRLIRKSLTIPIKNPLGGGVILTSATERGCLAFGSAYKRKKCKHFTIDYRNKDGKRVQRVIKDAKNQEEAEEALRIAFIKEFSIEDGRKQHIGFREFSEVYLQDYAMTEKKSWKTDEYRLRNLKEYFKDTDLRYINARMVRQFRAERLRKGNGEASCNRYLALLKRMFTLAIEDNYCETNPVKSVKFFSEANVKRERVLTQVEEVRLLDSCSEVLRPVVLTALHSGMRRGEILSLKWKNVDMLKKVITVEHTKSGKVRLIPLNDVLIEELTVLKKDSTGELVFPFPFGKVRMMFENARKRAELEVTFHALRHTFATRLVERGADIITVSQLLGHHSILVTQKYAHSNEDRKREAVELLKEPKKVHPGDKMVTKLQGDKSEGRVVPLFTVN